MYYIVIGLIIIVCILLMLVVLVQNSKGGGLAANFSSSNNIMGAHQTADFLEKATWGLAIALLALSLLASMTIPRDQEAAAKSMLEDVTPISQTSAGDLQNAQPINPQGASEAAPEE